MQKPKANLCAIRVAAIMIALSYPGLYQTQAHSTPINEKMKTPLKITWEIYSGRVSPYFEVKSGQELQEIETRLKDLPLVTSSKKESEGPGAYMFELPDKEKNTVRMVAVYRTEIDVRNGSQNYNYSDTKSLRKYLDGLKGKYKLISADGLPVR